MKKLFFILLLPIFAYSQERQIGTYSGGVYSFYWNMETVVQNAMPSQTIDTVYVQDTSHLKIVFKQSGDTYSDWLLFTVINGVIYTAISTGCQNSCKQVDCSDCTKKADCSCVCTMGFTCESKSLGIFGNVNISSGIRQYLLTHPNPDQ